MYKKLDVQDQNLVESARDVVRRHFDYKKHSVGAALLGVSGKIYAAINIDSCGFGPCAELIAIGMAISNGEKQLLKIVAVNGRVDGLPVLSPCGNCRQVLFDYSPKIEVILHHEERLMKTTIATLLPDPYVNGKSKNSCI